MFIYKITNSITQDFYVGQTKKSLKHRFNRHKGNARFGTDTHLYRAMRKYGEAHFTIEAIESQVPADNLNAREMYYIKELKPQYNMNEGGTSGNAMTTKHQEAMKKYHATRSKESYATYGMKGKKMSYETIQKVAKAKWKPCVVKGIEFPSILAACTHFEVSRSTIDRWKAKGLVTFNN